jgi:two-component system, sensor histidine kinase
MKTQPLRLLIVEDNLDTARMMKVLLKQEGHEARTASDGPEAIEIARLFRPHAVLLDLTLPGMSGSEVAGELRNLPELSGCVLIAISGWDAAMLAPFDYHFTKPVDIVALLKLLSGLAAHPDPSPMPTRGEIGRE